MPKQKTNKSLAKRIKVTGSGKLMRRRPCSGHLKSVKSPRQNRRYRKSAELPKSYVQTIRTLLGRSG